MTIIANPFDDPAFSAVELTDAINILPNQYGLIEQMGLMPDKPVRTRQIAIEMRHGVLTVIPTAPLGSPGAINKLGGRNIRTFTIPHIPLDDVILPAEYAGIRGFGQTDMEALADVMLEHLGSLRPKHDITLEYLRMGALRGQIRDGGNGGAVLYDLYDEFGVDQTVMDFSLSTAQTKVRSKCLEVSRHMDANLRGEVRSGVKVLCSPGFFEKLIEHASVRDAYAATSAAVDAMGGDPRAGFAFGGLNFIEYAGSAILPDGTTTQFIADGDAYAFPVGTMSAFSTYFAPADFLETVNTRGKRYYAKQEARKYNRGVDIHTQSNPLPLCKRPELVVKLTA